MISVFSGAFRGVCVAEKQKCFLIYFLKLFVALVVWATFYFPSLGCFLFFLCND